MIMQLHQTHIDSAYLQAFEDMLLDAEIEQIDGADDDALLAWAYDIINETYAEEVV